MKRHETLICLILKCTLHLGKFLKTCFRIIVLMSMNEADRKMAAYENILEKI